MAQRSWLAQPSWVTQRSRATQRIWVAQRFNAAISVSISRQALAAEVSCKPAIRRRALFARACCAMRRSLAHKQRVSHASLLHLLHTPPNLQRIPSQQLPSLLEPRILLPLARRSEMQTQILFPHHPDMGSGTTHPPESDTPQTSPPSLLHTCAAAAPSHSGCTLLHAGSKSWTSPAPAKFALRFPLPRHTGPSPHKASTLPSPTPPPAP